MDSSLSYGGVFFFGVWLGSVCVCVFLRGPQTGRFNFPRLNFYDDQTEDVAWFIYSAFDFIKAAQAQKGRVLGADLLRARGFKICCRTLAGIEPRKI